MNAWIEGQLQSQIYREEGDAQKFDLNRYVHSIDYCMPIQSTQEEYVYARHFHNQEYKFEIPRRGLLSRIVLRARFFSVNSLIETMGMLDFGEDIESVSLMVGDRVVETLFPQVILRNALRTFSSRHSNLANSVESIFRSGYTKQVPVTPSVPPSRGLEFFPTKQNEQVSIDPYDVYSDTEVKQKVVSIPIVFSCLSKKEWNLDTNIMEPISMIVRKRFPANQPLNPLIDVFLKVKFIRLKDTIRLPLDEHRIRTQMVEFHERRLVGTTLSNTNLHSFSVPVVPGFLTNISVARFVTRREAPPVSRYKRFQSLHGRLTLNLRSGERSVWSTHHSAQTLSQPPIYVGHTDQNTNQFIFKPSYSNTGFVDPFDIFNNSIGNFNNDDWQTGSSPEMINYDLSVWKTHSFLNGGIDTESVSDPVLHGTYISLTAAQNDVLGEFEIIFTYKRLLRLDMQTGAVAVIDVTK